ncbi:hypothetical protein [Tissierella sp.]|uniref:hypothetical protein n=1 Tax=Tissierella sp. TaxID=41274 RepID=UPI00305EF29A
MDDKELLNKKNTFKIHLITDLLIEAGIIKDYLEFRNRLTNMIDESTLSDEDKEALKGTF